MKSEVVFFEKKAIVQFLGNHGKEKTKDYEFVAALIILHFCEKRWGEKCWIGFRIRSENSGILPTFGSEKKIGLIEISQLLRGNIDEDSDVDFVVAKRANIQKAQGMVFQTKRFGIGRNKKDTDELITYLNSFSKKYAKTDASLLICLDDWVKIDMKKLYAGVNTANFPFDRVMFTWVSNNMVYLKDIYPQGSTEKYNITDLY